VATQPVTLAASATAATHRPHAPAKPRVRIATPPNEEALTRPTRRLRLPYALRSYHLPERTLFPPTPHEDPSR
jgi:hypothetical protein